MDGAVHLLPPAMDPATDAGTRPSGPGGLARGDKARRRSAELGTRFPYERMVAVPVVLTRARYAELVAGRGAVPLFPVPPA